MVPSAYTRRPTLPPAGFCTCVGLRFFRAWHGASVAFFHLDVCGVRMLAADSSAAERLCELSAAKLRFFLHSIANNLWKVYKYVCFLGFFVHFVV